MGVGWENKNPPASTGGIFLCPSYIYGRQLVNLDFSHYLRYIHFLSMVARPKIGNPPIVPTNSKYSAPAMSGIT